METWRQVDIGGKIADLLDLSQGSPQFAVIYLHSYNKESLAENDVFTRLLRELKLGCVCPRGERCWWAGVELVRSLTQRSRPSDMSSSRSCHSLRSDGNLSPAVGLIGVDIGGRGRPNGVQDTRRALLGRRDRAVDQYHELYWSGTPIDEMYSSKERCRQDTAPMHVHPSNFPPHIFFASDPTDPWHRGSERLHENFSRWRLYTNAIWRRAQAAIHSRSQSPHKGAALHRRRLNAKAGG